MWCDAPTPQIRMSVGIARFENALETLSRHIFDVVHQGQKTLFMIIIGVNLSINQLVCDGLSSEQLRVIVAFRYTVDFMELIAYF